MKVSVAAEIESRKAEGNFFRKDPSKTIMGNVLDMVEWLVDEGAKIERGNTPVDKGFTRANIEGFTDKRRQMITGAMVQSKYGKVRLRPRLTRTPASAAWPAARRPYVTMAVLNRTVKTVRRTWARLRIYERTIRRDLTKGLE